MDFEIGTEVVLIPNIEDYGPIIRKQVISGREHYIVSVGEPFDKKLLYYVPVDDAEKHMTIVVKKGDK